MLTKCAVTVRGGKVIKRMKINTRKGEKVMKAPDVIYVEFGEDANLAFEKQPFEETPAFINKDSLLEWAERMKSICKGVEPIVKAYQTVIDKIESL